MDGSLCKATLSIITLKSFYQRLVFIYGLVLCRGFILFTVAMIICSPGVQVAGGNWTWWLACHHLRLPARSPGQYRCHVGSYIYICVYTSYTIYWYRSSLTIHHTTHNASDDFVSSMLVIALVQASLLISDWIGSIISAHCEYWSWYRCQYWLQPINLNISIGLPACLLAYLPA